MGSLPLSPVLPVPLVLPVAPRLCLLPVREGERHSWTLAGWPRRGLLLSSSRPAGEESHGQGTALWL